MAAEWWSPVVSASAGLVGVAIGAWLTRWRDRDERRYAFLRRQLEEFYAPFCALRDEIGARGVVRLKVSRATDADWRAAFEGNLSVDAKQRIAEEKRPTLHRAIDYDNEQLRTTTIPAFKAMLALFHDKLWLVEQSTRQHYPALVEFVDVWDRFLAEAVPSTLPMEMGHGEEQLRGLYEDVEGHRLALRAKLREGKPL
jgi:hypothetical protein